MKKILIILALVVFGVCSIVSGEESLAVQFDINNPMHVVETWFGADVNDVENVLKDAGYQEDYLNALIGRSIGFLTYTSTKSPAKTISLFINKDTSLVNRVSLMYNPDKEVFSDLSEKLESTLGEPTLRAAYVGEYMGQTATFSEALVWQKDNLEITIYASGDSENDTDIYHVQNGKATFVLNIQDPSIEDPAKEELSEAIEILITPTPKPAALEMKVAVYSVNVGKNSIGSPDIEVRFINNESSSVDRIDFAIRGYDAYGKIVKGYGVYDYTTCFYDNKPIAKGKISESGWSWTLYGFDGIKTIEIAIISYHMTSGKSVEANENQYVWVPYK